MTRAAARACPICGARVTYGDWRPGDWCRACWRSHDAAPGCGTHVAAEWAARRARRAERRRWHARLDEIMRRLAGLQQHLQTRELFLQLEREREGRA